MIKILDLIITKKEAKLSKKEKCFQNKNTNNEKIKLYRALLNEIDKYNNRTKGTVKIRHYRYMTFKVDKGE